MTLTTSDYIDLSYSNAKTVVEKITAAFEKYGEQNVYLDLDTEWIDYSDDKRAILSLRCIRSMTEEEETAYKNKLEKQKRESLENARRQYEYLKRQLGE